jgi:oligosaccharyltransferase complex subunit alpha (ribophorin I)
VQGTHEATKDKEKIRYALYRVEAGRTLAPQASMDLVVHFVFTHRMKPYPAAISQNEKQLVQYHGNHFVFSPYTVQSQTTNVKLASSTIESKTEQAPTSVKGDVITYGPYEDIQPFSVSPMKLHFENNKPFVTATSVVKEIEISHWGNIAIETQVTLQNDGAALKGTFSRYDYQRNPASAPAVVSSLKQILAPGASDVYYRDEIGNISTSHLSLTQRGVTLDLIPRFPMFGGWKFGFYMGYNLPVQYYLFNDLYDSGLYMLNTTFGVIFDDAVIDELTVKIILPEGARDIEAHAPFPIDSQSTDVHYTYLDTTGRPVLILKKKNVISDHNKFFQVTYRFSQLSMLQEPLLLFAAFFMFFLFIMVYVRIEFNIGPSKQRATNADRIDELLSQLKGVMEQAAELHSGLDSSLNKLSKSKNTQQYTQEKQRTEVNLSGCTKELLKIQAELEDVDSDLAKKVRELQRKEEKKAYNQRQLHDNEISYRINKQIPKSAYEESKAQFENFYNTTDEEIESLLGDLTENL